MTQTSELEGTVSLVTGASSGIGEAAAVALAERGSAVAIAARRADRLEQLAGTIEQQGGTALVIEADVSSREQAADAVGRTVSELGRLDTLVNNAGVMLLGPIRDVPRLRLQELSSRARDLGPVLLLPFSPRRTTRSPACASRDSASERRGFRPSDRSRVASPETERARSIDRGTCVGLFMAVLEVWPTW